MYIVREAALHRGSVSAAEALHVGGLDLARRTGPGVARQRTRVSARLRPPARLAARVRQLVLVAVRLSDPAAEAVVVRKRLAVVVTALRACPRENLQL